MDGGMHEDIDITNSSGKPVRFNLEVAVRCDFADIFEVKSEPHRPPRPHQHQLARETPASCVIAYRNRDFCRAVLITVSATGEPAVYANGRISFEIALDPGETWHSCLLYDLIDGDTPVRRATSLHRRQPSIRALRVAAGVAAHGAEDPHRATRSSTASSTRRVDDMAALRLPIEGTDHMVFVPAAGLPWFVALFGRDSLIVSLQNDAGVSGVRTRRARRARRAGRRKERDDYRDAEPGKILHEMRYGELAHFKLIPHTPYYGTADATPLYLMVLHAAWRATGDRALIERHLPNRRRLPVLDRRLGRSRR